MNTDDPQGGAYAGGGSRARVTAFGLVLAACGRPNVSPAPREAPHGVSRASTDANTDPIDALRLLNQTRAAASSVDDATITAAFARDCADVAGTASPAASDRRRRVAHGRLTHGPSGTEDIEALSIEDGKVILHGPAGDLVVDLAANKVLPRPIVVPASELTDCAPVPRVGHTVVEHYCHRGGRDVWVEAIDAGLVTEGKRDPGLANRQAVVLESGKHGTIELLGVACIDGADVRVESDAVFWSDRHAVWARARGSAAPVRLYEGYMPVVAGRIGDDIYIQARGSLSVTPLSAPSRETLLARTYLSTVGDHQVVWSEMDANAVDIVLGARGTVGRVIATRSHEPIALDWLGSRVIVLDLTATGWRLDVIVP